MADGFTIRLARRDDAADLLAIYRPYVIETAVSFELEPPALAEFADRIDKALAGWQWLVAESDGEIAGYAYGSAHRARAGYRWSTEVSAYVALAFQGRGFGRALYQQLLADLAGKGYCHAFAGITLPNEASIALHDATGFTRVGVFNSVGYKFARWHDVAWYQRKLRDQPPAVNQEL